MERPNDSLLFNLQRRRAKEKAKARLKRINEPLHIVLFPLLFEKKNLDDKKKLAEGVQQHWYQAVNPTKH